jgi:hypothetical protein
MNTALGLEFPLVALGLSFPLFVLLQEPNAALLLGPRIRQRLGEAGDREIRRRAAIDDRRDDAGRHEGEGCQQADVPFALVFTLSNLGEGGNSPEPDVVDPSSGLSDGSK